MGANHKQLIQMALDRWTVVRKIYAGLKAENCQDGDQLITSVQSCISALDNLRARLVAALEFEQDREQAEQELADTVSLSYLRSVEQCVELVDKFKR